MVVISLFKNRCFQLVCCIYCKYFSSFNVILCIQRLPSSLESLQWFSQLALLFVYFSVFNSFIFNPGWASLTSEFNREFNFFLSSFEQLLNEISPRKSLLSIITGDFNAWSSSWWANDSTTFEGTSLNSLTSSNSFYQLINEPTHIQRNSPSCIDLIFTDQPSLAVNSVSS